MTPITIRDYTIDKVPAIFNCRKAKRITWALIAFTVGYFGIMLSSHFIA